MRPLVDVMNEERSLALRCTVKHFRDLFLVRLDLVAGFLDVGDFF
jgi:hypothetical protein